MRATPKTNSPALEVSILRKVPVIQCAHLRGPEDRGKCSPGRSARPSSWGASCIVGGELNGRDVEDACKQRAQLEDDFVGKRNVGGKVRVNRLRLAY